MKTRTGIVALTLSTLLFSFAVFAQRQANLPQTAKKTSSSVTNGKYKIDVTSVTKTHVMMGNMVPRKPNSDFLVVNLETNDPCFDADNGQECFDSKLRGLDKVTAACGTVKILDKTYDADGGGLIDRKLTCGFVIPQESLGSVVLQFRGYPDLKAAIGGDIVTFEGQVPDQKVEKKKPESASNSGQKLAAQMFKEGVPFCITDAVVEPPNKLNFTVQFNPNIPADKAVKGMLQVKEYPTGSGMFVEVTYARTIISPSTNPQTVAQEIRGLDADADGAVLIIRVIGIFPDTTSADLASGGIGASNRVKLERVNGKWVVATLNMDSK